tara:strand:+ start:1561 stop:2022 length:462 start_codon:yes stop_codon:yes gene_type:complete
MEIKLTVKQKLLIENYGKHNEQSGFSPVASRIYALLTVINLPHLTFQDIRDTLKISKSVTSTSLNTLIIVGYVSYRTVLGSRKRYFYPELEKWKDGVEKRLKNLQKMANIVLEIHKQKTAEDSSQKLDLEAYANFLLIHTARSFKELKDFQSR